MKRTINLVAALFEKADIRLLIFVLLCLNFLSFKLSSNEEAYLPLAKQFLDPEWIKNSFTFTEWPGNRVFFQLIAGWALKFMSFEQVAFFGRLLVFAIIAIPAGGFIKRVKIGNLAAIILLQLYLVRQTFFAGEFIFGDFEPKSFAYIMVFAGLNCLLDRKYLLASVWAVPAAYFHILVGGWFFVLVTIFTFFSTKKISLLIKQGAIFVVLISPYVFYLAKEIFGSGSVVNGVNIDQIYVFFRNPHHTAPLSVKQHLLRTLIQVAVTAVAFVLTLFVFNKKKGQVFDELYLLNVIILTILFVSLGVSLIDHKAVFLKYYPFRLAALGELFMYLYVFKYIEAKWNFPVVLQLTAILAGVYLITAATLKDAKGLNPHPEKPSYKELTGFISKNTNAEDVIIPLDDYNLSLSRITRREVFVIFKCDPGGGEKIYEWYHRVGERDKLVKDLGYINQLLKNYKLDYLLSNRLLPQNEELTPVFQNTDYYLYKIK
jgi:hypothetical protein